MAGLTQDLGREATAQRYSLRSGEVVELLHASDMLSFGDFYRLSVAWLSSSQKDVARTPLNPSLSPNGSTLVILQDSLDSLFIHFLHPRHNRRSAAQLHQFIIPISFVLQNFKCFFFFF